MQTLRPEIYIRYMDDIIFVENAGKIKKSIEEIRYHLTEQLHLPIIPKKIQSNTMLHGITCLGFFIQCIGKNTKLRISK